MSEKLEFFLMGLSINENGEPLASLLSQYGVFSEQVRDPGLLVRDILGEAACDRRYSPGTEVLELKSGWDEFKNELKHKNRFFPTATLFSSVLSPAPEARGVEAGVFYQLLEQLEAPVYRGAVFYRARISDTQIAPGEMGCPPPLLATGGRANPAGIPYLYLAENEETCIAEVRPANSSSIYVSRFRPRVDLKVLDLTSPRLHCSAASFEETQLGYVLGLLNFLELLSLELSKPVRAENSHLEYLPTQFLCELIKSRTNLQGIVFNSSFGFGRNFVFFSSDEFAADPPQRYIVSKTIHHFENVG